MSRFAITVFGGPGGRHLRQRGVGARASSPTDVAPEVAPDVGMDVATLRGALA